MMKILDNFKAFAWPFLYYYDKSFFQVQLELLKLVDLRLTDTTKDVKFLDQKECWLLTTIPLTEQYLMII